jgi:8-oxo-dGTP pyrophosphatase MutT (NUDIX family)
MERKIYFNTHFVILSDGKNTKFSGETHICNNKTEILHIITTYINNPTQDICIVYHDFEYLCNEVNNQFNYIEAAGGIVENEHHAIVCIYRNNMWDLPKGKAEKGETPEQTAIREVCEETGLHSVSIHSFICSTWHTYQHPKGMVLKQTYWYAMNSHSEQKLIPQIEEGITQIDWIPLSHISIVYSQTYQSIRDVLHSFYHTSNRNTQI